MPRFRIKVENYQTYAVQRWVGVGRIGFWIGTDFLAPWPIDFNTESEARAAIDTLLAARTASSC